MNPKDEATLFLRHFGLGLLFLVRAIASCGAWVFLGVIKLTEMGEAKIFEEVQSDSKPVPACPVQRM